MCKQAYQDGLVQSSNILLGEGAVEAELGVDAVDQGVGVGGDGLQLNLQGCNDSLDVGLGGAVQDGSGNCNWFCLVWKPRSVWCHCGDGMRSWVILWDKGIVKEHACSVFHSPSIV